MRPRILLPLVPAGRLLLGRAPSAGGVVLAYHDVDERPGTPEDYVVSGRQLRAHVRLTRRLGLRFVPLSEITSRLLSGEPTTGLAAVAFDDALVGVHRVALPLLAEEGVTATLFAVSAAAGVRPGWWRSARRTMTQAELGEAVACGWALAGHTRTHPSLPGLPARRLRDELRGARNDLEDLGGSPVDVLAYPYGHHDPVVRAAAQEAGFAAAYTFLNGRLSGVEDPLRLPRFTMGGHHSPPRFAYHLARAARSWPDTQLDSVTGPVPVS